MTTSMSCQRSHMCVVAASGAEAVRSARVAATVLASPCGHACAAIPCLGDSSQVGTVMLTMHVSVPMRLQIHGWDMHFTLTLVVWVILGATAWMAYQAWNRLDGDTRKAVEAATGVTSCTLATVAATLLCCTGFCFGGRLRRRLHLTPRPRALEKYAAVGLGSTSGASPADLVRFLSSGRTVRRWRVHRTVVIGVVVMLQYLDMVKRTVVNIIYQDSPQWLYDNRKQPFVSDAGFDLEYRVRGEDVPRTAHTMYVPFPRRCPCALP